MTPGLITRRPITPEMVLKGARELWEEVRENEGKVPWDEAEDHQRWAYIRRAQLVLQAAIPLDDDALRKLAEECERVRVML